MINFGRHEHVALSFSGGKDSLACLYLLKPQWNQILVLWVNTGDAAPETLEQMNKVRAMVPFFIEVNSNQPANIAEHGLPVDLLPVWDSPLGSIFSSSRVRLQAAMGCCMENIWLPLGAAIQRLGVTLVIRGQRNEEGLKSPLRSGHTEGGVEYLFPIQDWTEKQVLDFLSEQGVDLPRNYGAFNSSMDCMHCTAYLRENEGKLAYLAHYYPEVGREVKKRLLYIHSAVTRETSYLNRALENHA